MPDLDPSSAEQAPTSRSHHDNTPEGWDARYAEADRMWSGDPNGLLVAEVGSLTPGRALDVGCGEGADALWLASRGWDVTAVDISRVALERARAASQVVDVHVDWRLGDVQELLPELGTFDLVSAFYPVLEKGSRALQLLLGAVSPGGELLFVHHVFGDDHAAAHGFDPDDYVQVDDVPAALDASWRIVKHARVGREVRGGAGAHHRLDGMVRAVRL